MNRIRDYDFRAIEEKWRKFWENNRVFRQPEHGDVDFDGKKPKIYVLDMFPYPSGNGLHVGHPEGYTATDIVCRYKRARGFNVLHPMGWDAFGLPAERHAMKAGIHPAVTTRKNCATFRRQIKMLGLSYDWDREINTTDPAYYKWTQWIFLKLYEKGLAYYQDTYVNWDPVQNLVVANEEIAADGTNIDTGTPIEKKKLKQWVLKITAYAERLLKDLDELDWPEGIKEQQRNWIGRSVGADVLFKLDSGEGAIEVYTTRPDTLFGATYMVLAPEHPLVEKITSPEHRAAVEKYRAEAMKKSDLERGALNKEKTGEFTGAYAINPVNAEKVPVWIADYVLMGYGTGAIMAVPAHDERDFEFACKFNIPVKCIIDPGPDVENREKILRGEACWTGNGKMLQSASEKTGADINGLRVEDAKKKITEWLEAGNQGKAAVRYKLRDWVFSRQRYWGEPIPVIHWEDGRIEPLSENELPLTLPEVDDYLPSPTGESPLAKAGEWLEVIDPKTGLKGRRETNTMPQWAGSCWYYLRFIDPHNDREAWSKEAEKYWMPIDLYVGGAEHAVLHLLYARFWHKVLYDLGLVSTREPFRKLFNQGMIVSYAYQDSRGKLIPVDQVEERDGKFFDTDTGEEVRQTVAKMSKSLRNVVNPDDVVREYGADTLRLYEMYMGPLEASKPWNTEQINGVHRFLQRVWRLFSDLTGSVRKTLETERPADEFLEKLLHRTIKKVGDDIENLRFNTAIAAMIEFVNAAMKNTDKLNRSQAVRFVQLLAPFAPHISEELWERLGMSDLLAYYPWPEYDDAMLVDETVEIAVQVSGKVRARIKSPVGADKEAVLAAARKAVASHLEDRKIIREIFVPGRLVNIVAK